MLSSNEGRQVWQMGALSSDVPNPAFERTLIDDVLKAGSLRIINLGTTAGALRIQEVWVQGSRIGKSVTRTFDQFAKSIDMAGYTFQVLEAKGDRLKLRYDIPSRTEITFTQVRKIALQNNKD